MARRKKPPTQPPSETPTQVETPVESPTRAPIQAETKPQVEAPKVELEIRKISNEEYMAYNAKPENEYVRIARYLIEKAIESDTPLLIRLPETISARRITPILAKIVSDLWKSGVKVEFKVSYKRNEIAIRHIKG